MVHPWSLLRPTNSGQWGSSPSHVPSSMLLPLEAHTPFVFEILVMLPDFFFLKSRTLLYLPVLGVLLQELTAKATRAKFIIFSGSDSTTSSKSA